MRARRKILLGAVTTASLLTAGLIAVTVSDGPQAIARPPAAPAPLPEVQVIEAITRTLPETAVYTGRLAAVEHVGVRPRVGGYIEAVRFREGGMVTRGQVLFELDARPFRAAVARARAQLLQAQERRTLAERRAARAQTLRREDVISQAELESASAEQADSAAAVEAARAMVRLATIDLADTRVRAPISGRVGEALVTRGNLIGGAASGGTLLTTIVSVDPLHVELDVDESTFRRLAAAGPGAPVHVQLADEPGPGREAKLDFLSNQIDPATGTARVRAVLANPDGALTPGSFARVRVETGAPRPVVLIRDEAIGTSAQGRHVLVVRPDGGVEPRPVQLGESVEGLRVVHGVTGGELVILKGMARPGMTVKPVKATPPGGVP
ncbi:MAG: efflux RND transporter periplasmic adaptor subunit [Deltaproteobacteria bacterium]|nr:efflux RND transporter periplasmic adaptor subunit [Kofleriaceae bacterium]